MDVKTKMETVGEYIEKLIREAVNEEVKNALGQHQNKPVEPERPIKGIHALAKFLNISVSRAQKLKNSGVLPFFQSSRLVLFDPIKVREALANHKIQPKKWTRIDSTKIK